MIILRVLCFCFACFCASAFVPKAFSQQVALTVDDLPAHGALPPGMTRADVAKIILKELKDAHTPKVYGFINARKLEEHPEDMEVLKLWRRAGFPLGNHTYAHLSLNDSSVEQFDQNVAADESTLKSLMGRQDWRSEEHTSELQSPDHLVCRLLLEKKKKRNTANATQ